jgi:starch-binding outer membrane protein, SusD/RagB family
MKANKILITLSAVLSLAAACTKLAPTQRDSQVNPAGAGGNISPTALLSNAYNDFGSVLHDQDKVFSLEETVTDEALIPTRGGDWDDNGVWRTLHAHTWDVTHTQAQTVFNLLGKMESDATTVLAFNPSTAQAAEAIFIRSFAQFYLLDLYGQVPYRTVALYNGIDAPPVLTPTQAIDTLVQNLTAIIPVLSAANTPYKASPDAARFLLMRVLLNKQAFLNKQAPAAADAGDMATVISLGNAILNNTARYSLTAHYFDNFGPNNGGTDPVAGYGPSTEMILAYPNLPGTANNNGINSAGIDARWMMTLHYNSYGHKGDNFFGNAGWNGFSTVADFYNSFEASDSMRKGNVAYPGVTNISGMKVGFLNGPQLDEHGAPRLDRNLNPLVFSPTVALIEPDPKTLEGDGIRVIKYPPDYANYSSGQQGNQLQIFRFADALLMVAEAHLRSDDAAGAGASLTLVNQLRVARKATPVAGPLKLVNSANLYDPNTLLAERGKEMYWESVRREDLIRMGVFLQPWALKTADDPKYLLYPIPAPQLVANPNLKQNPGY